MLFVVLLSSINAREARTISTGSRLRTDEPTYSLHLFADGETTNLSRHHATPHRLFRFIRHCGLAIARETRRLFAYRLQTLRLISRG